MAGITAQPAGPAAATDPEEGRQRSVGAVSIPGIDHTTTAHPGNGVYTHTPDPGVPTWAIVLIVLGALILALLLGILAVPARQHRHAR